MPVLKQLTETLFIQDLTLTGSSYQLNPVWSTIRIIKASITTQKGDVKDVDGNTYEDVVSFWCRYTPVFSKKGIRVKWNGQNYQILNYTHVQRNQNTIIDCVAVS